ncbi:MAG: hypothetical protein C5B53_13195 [Candidatus Melainabacteria bacterium]|nr:MAG: hypothetical protein C5B53_13195 [Candidatus Melainabacteria bacterium]
MADELEEVMQRTNADLSGLEETSEGDRLWFEARPKRNFRLREATAHERSVGTHSDHVLVCQVEPGTRARLPVIVSDMVDVDRAPEAMCAAIFEHITADSSEPGILWELRKRMRSKFWKLSKKVKH